MFFKLKLKRVRQGVYKDIERRQALLDSKEKNSELEMRKLNNIQILEEQAKLKSLLSEKEASKTT